MSELKSRSIWESRRPRWTMIMSCRLLVGLLVLNVVLASPRRYTRQVETDNYDVDLDNLDLENADLLEYYDELEEPKVEIGTLAPDEDSDPAPGASLEEEEEEEEVKQRGEENRRKDKKKESPIKPKLIPSGSGEPRVSMGPDSQGEEELLLAPFDILHIPAVSTGSGDMLSSRGSETPMGSGETLGSRISGSGEPLGSGGSGDFSSERSADVGYTASSEGSAELGSGVSEDFVTRISEELVLGEIVSGGSEDFVSGVSGDLVSGVSGDLVSGVSGDIIFGTSEDLVSGVSGDFVSGVSEDHVSGVSGDLVSGVSGDFVSGFSGDLVSGVSGDHVFGVSGDLVSGVSEDLDSGVSGDIVFGVSGDFVSGASGDLVSGASGDLVSGASGDFVPGASGELVSGTSGDLVPGASEDLSGASVDLGSGPSGAVDSGITLVPDREEELHLRPTIISQEAYGASGESEIPVDSVTVIPDIREEEELLPTTQTSPQEGTGDTIESGSSSIPDIDIDIDFEKPGMPTCLLCTCLGGSVYCDDVKLIHVPPLPKDTTHFYARYNKITKINKSDFANMNKLKRIDLTNNAITKIDDGALFGLPALEELVIRENNVAQLPALPPTMTLVDASHNKLGRTGIQNEAFKDMTGLLYLYLTDNNIDYVPVPLPDSLRSLHLQNNNIQMIHEDTFCNLKDLNYIRQALEDIRLDGNPINLSRTPQAYVCLPRIPVGALI